ncbi:hypothetical protein [Croceicoccus bisphenolivorans]|uniref:hypothetical protein n=1 Tax=Croceicoccus bisphenolivorans TaxID=1783232 RepID=UPI00082AF930|nr:hypothetical protein [Croceicoccus bisphenolivorans]
MKPVTIDLDDIEKTAREMFEAADLNSDGMVTIAELQDLTDRARDQAIGERFRSVDTNGNQLIDPAEFSAWQHSLGALAYRDDGSRAYDVTHLPDAVGVPSSSNKKGPLLSIVMVPLSKITLIEANTNYDEGIDFREFLILQRKEFDKADGNSDGRLTDQEIRAWADGRRSQRPDLIAGERPSPPGAQSRDPRAP